MAIKPFRMKESYGELSYNDKNKAVFLKDAAKLMRVIGRSLMTEPYCYPYTCVTVNKAGIAVSGEVYLMIVLPDLKNGIMCQISQASFYPEYREDRLKILLQYRQFNSPVNLKGKVKLPASSIHGSNQWFEDAVIDSDDLLCWVEMHIMQHPCIKPDEKDLKKAQEKEAEILKRGDLTSESFQPESMPTVKELIDTGGELGQMLSKIKNTMDGMNKVINEYPVGLDLRQEMVENHEKLNDDAFKESGANVATGVLIHDKKSTPEPVMDIAPPSNDDTDSLMSLFAL